MTENIIETVRLNINSETDRQHIVWALVNSGYQVWVTTVFNLYETQYYVCANTFKEEIKTK